MTYYLEQSTYWNFPDGLRLIRDFRPGHERVETLLYPAIRAEQPNQVFIDLGCGTGLLGLYALSHGAKFVYFVEQNDIMCEILEQILPKKIPQNKFKIIHSDIQNLKSSHFLEYQPDVIISELLGPRLFDEGYVQYIKDIKKILPASVKFIPEELCGEFYLQQVDHNNNVYPVDKRFIDYFKLYYQKYGYCNPLQNNKIARNNIKNELDNNQKIGTIMYNASSDVLENNITFMYNDECEKLLTGILFAKHQNLIQYWAKMYYLLDEKDYKKTIRLFFDENNYFNPSLIKS